MIWVVDATDRERLEDCRAELAGLLLEEVGDMTEYGCLDCMANLKQRLMGASLLVFKNKSDVAGAMDEMDIRKVGSVLS